MVYGKREGRPDFEVIKNVYNYLQILQNVILMSTAGHVFYNHIQLKGKVAAGNLWNRN